ncbi:hypothetical protein HU200_057049 [Digitaria exilis]|uniref:Peptidase A1 domain-containing protein n=1 Tax=Digitaria exilis TaxID=1010633 RepID=A0A835E3A4_9POAL|nr:hypothetical protein HU200_057049 [Digitaria exilis]
MLAGIGLLASTNKTTMGRMVLAAAATWLLLTSALQVSPLASGAFIPRPPPRIGSLFLKPARAQKIGQSIKGFLKKHGDDILDIIAQSLSPSPVDSTGSGGHTSTSAGGAPATTAGLYVADLLVGTPPKNISGVLEITSELVWMQCSSCTDYCLPPPASSFDPTNSSTAQPLPCNNNTCQALLPQTCSTTDTNTEQLCGYAEYYGGSNNDTTQGYFVFDTFTFDTTAVDDMLFGCSDSSTGNYSGASGVIGLGRGELSLVSQLGISNFSYFLAPNGSTGSGGESGNRFQLGGVPVPAKGLSTPLYNSSAYPNLYYVGLTGVYVDDEEVAGIPAGTFDLQSNGSGGVFLSTTMSVTYLLSDAYTLVREAFARKISAQPYSIDPLCYVNDSVTVIPELTLAFNGVDGGGDVKMKLSEANYFFEYNDGESEVQCLTVLPSVGASVLGSLLQTGTQMIYDLDREQLTFVVTEDTSLASAAPAASQAMAVALAVWVVRLLI